MTSDPLLWRALAKYRGWTYGYGPLQVVCSVFTAEILQALTGWPRRRGDALWLDLQIDTLEAPWEPVTSLATVLGRPAITPASGGPHRPELGRLHLCQGWRGLRDGFIVQGSSGHAWLWLADPETPWLGVVIESSATGPRLWDASGKWPAAQVVSEAGALERELHPMNWSMRAAKWSDGVAWVAL